MENRAMQRAATQDEKRSTHRRLFALARAAEVQACAEDVVQALVLRKGSSDIRGALQELKYFSEELHHEAKAYLDSLAP